MLKTIASLQGVSILSRDAQKRINGGLAESGSGGGPSQAGVCAIRITGGDYGSTVGAINFGTSTNPSTAANAYCTNYVNNNGGRCQYDCVYDGLQSSWASQVIVS